MQGNPDDNVLPTSDNDAGRVDSQSPERMMPDLSEADMAVVRSFSEKIDLSDSDGVLLYGADAQRKISKFADGILANVTNTDSGNVISELENLVSELQAFQDSAQKPTGLRALFARFKAQTSSVRANYEKVAVNIEKIAGNLETQQIRLLKDVALLTRMYDLNLDCFRQLTMYIGAGEIKLKQMRDTQPTGTGVTISAGGGVPFMAQSSGLLSSLDRFEKKLHDLKLTRQISMQMALQIRIMQSNNNILIERIQSTLSNTLPLWKNQIVLALGMDHARDAMVAQRAAANYANDYLIKNADDLKRGVKAAAREAGYGVTDMETLVKTNRFLMETVNEVIRVQVDSRNKRAEAEKNLADLESELKQKMN